MRGGGGGRRKFLKASIGPPERAAPPPLPSFDFATGGGRDSDASLCSSRPSSVGGRPSVSSALLTDRSSQSAALRAVNAFLASQSAPVSLKPPLPSARDITDAFRFILSSLDWELLDLDDDLPVALRQLRCPIKLNRSALRAPGTPHAWPPLLSVLYWLVQLARISVADQPNRISHSDPNENTSDLNGNTSSNDLVLFLTRSYGLFITGEDDEAAELDEEYLSKAKNQAVSTADAVARLGKEAAELESKVQALKSQPSKREALEREKGMLVEDVKKFQAVVDTWGAKVAGMENSLKDFEKELDAKEKECTRLHEENEELQKRVELQVVNVRDVERMKREMQGVERDIRELDQKRSESEEKAWELDDSIRGKLNAMEVILEHCNQAVKKLKFGSDCQYVLNAKGSSAGEILGSNYKTTLKAAITALSEEMKKLSVSKMEESIVLQEQSRQHEQMLEDKKCRLAAFQEKIDEAEAHLTTLRRHKGDYVTRCVAEVEKLKQEFARKESQLNIVEREAEEFLKDAEKELGLAKRESDEETQMCASELLALIDAVSEYKEFMENTVCQMKAGLSENADAIAGFLQ